MNRNIWILGAGLLGVLMLWTACSPDESWMRVDDGTSSGFTLQLSLPAAEEVVVSSRSTASATECRMTSLYMFVYRGVQDTPLYADYFDAALLSSYLFGNETNAPKLALNYSRYQPEEDDRIYLFANTGPVSLTLKEDAIPELLESMPESGEEGDPIPMSGKLPAWKSKAAANVCVMKRTLAKIEVDAAAAFPGKAVEWKIVNASMKNYLAVDAAVNATLYAGETFDGGSWKSTGSGYCYYIPEYKNSTFAGGTAVTPATAFSAKRICALLRVDGKFFRIDFHRNGEGYLDILRNHNYRINVIEASSAGYATAQEALANPGSNVVYEITVEDADNVTVSNGQYAIVTTNDDCLIYDSDDTGVYEVAGVKFISCGDGSVTTNRITVDGDATLLSSDELTSTETPVRLNVYGTSATVTLKYGNLEQVITVTRRSSVDAHPIVLTLEGALTEMSVRESTLTGPLAFYNDATTTRLCIPENVLPANAASVYANPAVEPVFEEKRATVYLNWMKPANSSRRITKFMVRQMKPDYVGWFGNKGSIGAYTYYTRRLLCESVEEGETLKYYAGGIDNPLAPMNNEDGLENTLVMGPSDEFEAARYCYLKNDRNGNGMIDSDEPVVWYLPANDQLNAMWVTQANFSYPLAGVWYWSSSRNFSDGYIYADSKCGATMGYFAVGAFSLDRMTENVHVRCVRDID